MLGHSVIELVDVCKSFKGQKVLDGINLSVDSGRITVIIGRSGGGKSVLLKHIIGLLKPDKGQILIDGTSSGSIYNLSFLIFTADQRSQRKISLNLLKMFAMILEGKMELVISTIANILTLLITKTISYIGKILRKILLPKKPFKRRYHQRRNMERRRGFIPVETERRCIERRQLHDRRRVTFTFKK